MKLTEKERESIVVHVSAIEARTGTKVVAAVVGKSDSYPEAPWKAFALGSGAIAVAAVVRDLVLGDWAAGVAQTENVWVILAGGAFFALLTLLFSPIARLFIDRTRRHVEVMQFAQSLFLRHGLHRTRGRLGILLLVSLFERQVVILADEGFEGRIGAPEWNALTRRITLLLRHGTIAIALRAGLDALLATFLERGFTRSGGGELAEVLDAKDEP